MDSQDAQIFDDTFTVTAVSHEKYDRVARVSARNSGNDITITLDINHDLYQLNTGEQFQLVLAKTLNLDGSAEEKGWKDLARSGQRTLADDFDYVMRGKLYRTEHLADQTMYAQNDGKFTPSDRAASSQSARKVYVSFGGLILFMEGAIRKFYNIKIDYLYLLIKK